VRPALLGLESVSGTLPLGEGVLSVGWERPDCEHAFLNVSASAGFSGEIVIPRVGPTTAITLNQTLIWENGVPLAGFVFRDGEGVRIGQLTGGTYHIDIQQRCISIYLPLVVSGRSTFDE